MKRISQPYQISRHEVRISASIGIALYPGDGQTRHELMINADAAMYHAKDQGRNGYCFFESSMNANAQEQLQLLHDPRQAPGAPATGLALPAQGTGAERTDDRRGSAAALGASATRADHPGQFLPLAEKTGLIVQIGEWVLDEACRQMRLWLDGGHADWNIAVNLSAPQFAHAGLVDSVRNALLRHSLEPSHLILEVTESTAMRDADASLVILEQLSAMGVGISIDDFGTGYSSLLYLKRLPASELKIDRGFINELAHDSDDAAIVSAIVALGRTLNLKIVAEGVETEAQQEFLTRLGCNSLQGFLLGRPMPAEQLLAASPERRQRATGPVRTGRFAHRRLVDFRPRCEHLMSRPPGGMPRHVTPPRRASIQ